MDFVKRTCWTVLGVLVAVVTLTQAQQVVQLSTGLVQGVVLQSVNNVSMNVFRRIPYAQPPIGALRFMAPVAVANWTTQLNLTTDEPAACAQIASYSGGYLNNSVEDCLYLNVYSPQSQSASSTTKLPVMVLIHRGLEAGSSAYASNGPDYFVEQGVIFVSFNFRLGALGFLNLNTSSVPGNAGLKDQRLALQWVKDEIANFGGDNSRITVFGAGASVSFHYISPNSQGLFTKAIAHSGNAYGELTFLESGYLERASTFAGLLNCTDSTGAANLTCLQAADVTSIVSNQQIPLNDTYLIPGATLRFPATPETAANMTSTPVLTGTAESMIQTMVAANLTRVPLILGVNQDEGASKVTSNATFYSDLVTKLKYFIPAKILAKKSASEITNNSASIYQEYFNSTPPSLTNLDGYIRLYGDKLFKVGTANFSRQVATFGNIYLYHFGYSGSFSQNLTTSNYTLTGKVNHGDEMNYLLLSSTANQAAASVNSSEMTMLNKMVKMWTNFAYYSNPTPDVVNTTTVLSTLKWTPVASGNYSFLHIVSDIQMNTTNFYAQEITFWNTVNNITTSSTSYGIRATYSVILILSVLLLGKML